MGCPVSKVMQDVEAPHEEDVALRVRALLVSEALEAARGMTETKTPRSWRRQWADEDLRTACRVILHVDALTR
ncbi:Hypothetical Protein FCC1311_097612 [Hondaea fermentalgiana]|uniref:Uncharacterized protein n=1 Tax=Hondaea fermentalgiana TaxID=2315210 RepID=A0A2R5GUU7_9STRA|nr:Hypothetical Protein FCC1311_097612 [Hondaea fermentalgiana]|eukprot:GBG33538.1 Hypothetical Protein FCC1311_097612 [Hondaea fermentalgiana]